MNKPKRVALINMPVAPSRYPSLALTQLSHALEKRLGERVSTTLHYVNHDFAVYIERDFVEPIRAGFGDWLFRQVAFPGAPDNSEEYLARYYQPADPAASWIRQLVQTKRPDLESFFVGVISERRLADYDLIGFTLTYDQTVASIAMARLLKEINPSITTVFGGCRCASPMGDELVRQVEAVDWVFVGPALRSFPLFVERWLEADEVGCRQIPGALSKETVPDPRPDDRRTASGAGVCGRRSLPESESADLESDVIPDFGAFLASYKAHFPSTTLRPHALIETSRGCWWGDRSPCSFCAYHNGHERFRAMSSADAAQYIRGVVERYAAECDFFQATDSIIPSSYLKEVLPQLKLPKNVVICYETRVNLSTEDMNALAGANIKILMSGVEALSTEVLRLMHKGTTAFQNIRFLKRCVEHSVATLWTILVGAPGMRAEVYERYLSVIPLLTHLPPPNGVFPIGFYRYCEYFEHAATYGLELHPYDHYELTYPFTPDSVRRLAFFFTDDRLDAEYFVTMTAYIDRLRKQVDDWMSRWPNPPSGLFPKLYWKQRGDAPVIYDSRSGKVVEHRLPHAAALVLDHLENADRTESLNRALPELRPGEVSEALGILRELGLLFEEGPRAMSLVLPAEPPPPFAFPDLPYEPVVGITRSPTLRSIDRRAYRTSLGRQGQHPEPSRVSGPETHCSKCQRIR